MQLVAGTGQPSEPVPHSDMVHWRARKCSCSFCGARAALAFRGGLPAPLIMDDRQNLESPNRVSQVVGSQGTVTAGHLPPKAARPRPLAFAGRLVPPEVAKGQAIVCDLLDVVQVRAGYHTQRTS